MKPCTAAIYAEEPSRTGVLGVRKDAAIHEGMELMLNAADARGGLIVCTCEVA